MIFGRKKRLKTMSLILVVAMLLSMSVGMNLTTTAATKKPVVIKTQSKADSLVKSGAIRGIDVSKWNETINWSKVAADEKNIKFAFVRANYGAEPDPNFVTNMNGARENGIKVGAYHYSRFKTEETMEAEADAFIAQLKKVKVTYPVVLDVENHYGLSKDQLTNLCLGFIKKLEAKGYKVMLYTYENFYKSYLNPKKLDNVSVWIANYKEYPSSIPHDVWQHTSSAKVDGIKTNVDINISYKDLTPVKPIEVDAKISKNIITFMNETLGADMDAESIDMDALYMWTSTGIQRDLARDFDSTIVETGALNNNDITAITKLSGKDITSNNIMKYIQARLFYKGFYAQELTGSFDSYTEEALKKFQLSVGMDASGILGKTTLRKLFNVPEEDATSPPKTQAEQPTAPATATTPKASTGTKVEAQKPSSKVTTGTYKGNNVDTNTVDGDFN